MNKEKRDKVLDYLRERSNAGGNNNDCARHTAAVNRIFLDPRIIEIYEQELEKFKEVVVGYNMFEGITDIVFLGDKMHLVEIKTENKTKKAIKRVNYEGNHQLIKAYAFYKKNFAIAPERYLVICKGRNIEYRQIERPIVDIMLDF